MIGANADTGAVGAGDSLLAAPNNEIGVAVGVVVAESWLEPDVDARAGDFAGSFASSPPVFNISAKDVLVPT